MYCTLDCQGQIGGITGFIPTTDPPTERLEPDVDDSLVDDVVIDSNSTDFENDTDWESLLDEEDELLRMSLLNMQMVFMLRWKS